MACDIDSRRFKVSAIRSGNEMEQNGMNRTEQNRQVRAPPARHSSAGTALRGLPCSGAPRVGTRDSQVTEDSVSRSRGTQGRGKCREGSRSPPPWGCARLSRPLAEKARRKPKFQTRAEDGQMD